MLFALISTFLESFSDIFWKKSLNYKIGFKLHDLILRFFWLFIIIYFLFTWVAFNQINLLFLIIVFCLTLANIFSTQFYQIIYQKEKISVITPYSNINKIFVIIASFFIFSDVSIISLIITFLAILIVIGFSIDFKNLKLPKSISLIIFTEIFYWIITLWVWWLILKYNASLYFFINFLLSMLLLAIIWYFLWEFKTFKNANKSFYFNIAIASLCWISEFLWLIVIQELWLSVWILLSFLWIWITLIFSYLILKDKPAKKDLLLTVIITILVGLGYYFK